MKNCSEVYSESLVLINREVKNGTPKTYWDFSLIKYSQWRILVDVGLKYR